MPDETSCLDMSALSRLQRIGKDALVAELITLFFKQVPEWVKTIDQEHLTGDLAKARLAAHSLKSSAANLGVITVRDLAFQIEQLAVTGNRQAITPLVEKLRGAYEQARPLLEQQRPGKPS